MLITESFLFFFWIKIRKTFEMFVHRLEMFLFEISRLVHRSLV